VLILRRERLFILLCCKVGIFLTQFFYTFCQYVLFPDTIHTKATLDIGSHTFPPTLQIPSLSVFFNTNTQTQEEKKN